MENPSEENRTNFVLNGISIIFRGIVGIGRCGRNPTLTPWNKISLMMM